MLRAIHKPPLTQLALSLELNEIGIEVDRSGIAKIENGLRCVFDYEIVGLANILKVPISKLLTGRR